MSRDLLLGLDLGTTRVCALLIDAEGDTRAQVHRPLRTLFPGAGRVEQDPRELYSESVAALAGALHEAGVRADRVAGIGIATQRATTLAWEHPGGTPLGPAIGWQDQRTAPRAEELRAQGIPVTALASITKFEWWLAHDPAIARAAAAGRLRFGTPDTWLADRLSDGAAYITEPGEASCTGLYDLARGDWNDGALAFFSIPRETLPPVVASDAIAGETPASVLGAAVPIAARVGDQQAAAFAQAVHDAGAAKLTLGTAAMLNRHVGGAPPAFSNGAFPLALWRLADTGDAFCREGNVITAGAVVDWLVDLGLLGAPADLDRMAGSVPDAGGAVFVPALQGLGTPWLDEDARGQLGGLTRGSTRAHVLRAVVDGLAQRCADLCDALDVPDTPLAVDGGVSQSDLLLQTVADLTGRTLERADNPETTARGAALLAGLATDLLPNLEACAKLRPTTTRFEPRRDRRPERDRWPHLIAPLISTPKN